MNPEAAIGTPARLRSLGPSDTLTVMPAYEPQVSKKLLQRIDLAGNMHNFVQASLPQASLLDTDEKQIILALYSLAAEHHGAILHLLKTGCFDGSAMALTRPLVDAVYRALWLHYCGKPNHFQAVREGKDVYPPLPNMADAIEQRADTDGLFTVLKPFIKTLHGFTHGGLEQLARRFDAEGNVRAAYSDDMKIEAINAITGYLVMLAVAWCHIEAGINPEPRSAKIVQRYNETCWS
jgi:hypothetical protein